MSAKAIFGRIIIFVAILVFLGVICFLSLSGNSSVASKAFSQKTMTEVAESGLSDVTNVTISSKAELDIFSDYVNSGNTTEDINFLLEADIDYNDFTTANAWCEDITPTYVWSPIGTAEHPFAGHFLGKGHTIGGLFVKGLSATGFFGYIDEASIENINILDSCFISTGSMAGTIAGSAKNSIFSDCSTNQRFKEDKVYNLDQVAFYRDYSYYWYSYNSASVKAVEKVGGLIGYAENTTVENSYSFAFVEGSDEVGGIVGELNGGSVTNCYSKGKLTNTSSTQTGGIAGKILNGATVEYGYYFDEIAESAIGGELSPVADTGTKSSFGLNGKLATSVEIDSSTCDTIYSALNVWASQNADYYWTNAIFPELTTENYTALPVGGDTTSAVWDGTTAVAFAGGTGTEEDPYQIATAEQLKLLSVIISANNSEVINGYTVGNMRAAHYILTANIRLNDENFTFIPDTGLIEITDGTNTVYLGTGILGAAEGETYFDNTASTENTYYEKSGSLWTESTSYSGTINYWVPIGTTINDFIGIFDGSGYTVSGMYVDMNDNIGLFCSIDSSSEIKNLTVSQSLVRGKEGYTAAGIVGSTLGNSGVSNCKNSAIILGKYSAGGIAATVGSTFGIRNCLNEGVIIKNFSSIYCSAGGIAGKVEGPNPIVECANTGDILSSYQNEYSILGGIVGASDGYARALLYHCYNSGNIRGGNILGGILAYTGSSYNDNGKTISVSGCENYGEITGDGNNLAGDNVGGIVGLSDDVYNNYYKCYTGGIYSIVSGCNNFGNVYSRSQNVGGILGKGLGYGVFLLSCNNYGDISANGKDSVANAGGIAGSTSYYGSRPTNGLMQTIVACVNFGTVTSLAGYSGGIVADAYYDFSTYFTYLSYCVNYGAINGESYTAGIASRIEDVLLMGCINYGAISSTGICAGGICAYQTMNVAYDNGSIFGCVNKGAVTAASQAGGITGAAYSHKIENSYNIGTVSSSSDSAGGIIGYCPAASAELYSCYYLAGCATDGQSTVQNAVGSSAQGETTADLSTVKSFAADGTLSVTIDNTDFYNLQSALCYYFKYHAISNASGFTDETIPGIQILPLRFNIKVSCNYNGIDIDPRYIVNIFVAVGTNKTYVNYVDDILCTMDTFPKIPCHKVMFFNKRDYSTISPVIYPDFSLEPSINWFTDVNGNWAVPEPRKYLYAFYEEISIFKEEPFGGWCSELYERTISGYNETQVNVSYDDCNPFGMIAGDFGEIASLSKHTTQTLDYNTMVSLLNLSDLFATFMGNFTIPTDGTEYIPEIGYDALNDYKDFFNNAKNIFTTSLVPFARDVDYYFYGQSAVIGINHPYSMSFGSLDPELIDFQTVIANLFGFSSLEDFTDYAQDLADTYADYRTRISNPTTEDQALANGCFYSLRNGSFVFPIAVTNELSYTVLAYVILDTSGLVSVWVSNMESALWATNFNSSYHTDSVINNKIYCKNILFLTGSHPFNVTYDGNVHYIEVETLEYEGFTITYQWYKDVTYNSGLIAGANSSTYGVTNTNENGRYYCKAIITDDGSGSSWYRLTEAIVVTIKPAPPISTQPVATNIKYFPGICLWDIQFSESDPAGQFKWKAWDTAISVADSGSDFTAVFTPSDSNYGPVEFQVTITVAKADPIITAPTASSATYYSGIKLKNINLEGGEAIIAKKMATTAPVEGNFVWKNPETDVSSANDGATFEVLFVPDDSVNYNEVTINVTLDISKVSTSVTSAPSTNTLDYIVNMTLADIPLVSGEGSVAGSFAWTEPNTEIHVADSGSTFSVTFTPTDSVNYETITCNVEISLNTGTNSVTSSGYDEAYDGAFHGITVTPTTGTISYSLDNADWTTQNPTYKDITEGLITVYFKVESPDFYTLNGQETIRISPKEISVKWYSLNLTYNGYAQKPWASVSTGIQHDGQYESLETNITGAQTDASTSAYIATVSTTNPNFTLTNTSTEFFIAKANYNMSGVTFVNETSVYDGAAHSLTVGGTLPTGRDGIQLTVFYEGSATTVSEGAVTVTATFETTSKNYNTPAPMTATITITKADYDMSAVVWDYTNPFVADGTVKTVSLLHLPEGVTAQYTGNSATAANAYTASAVLSGNPNYNTPSVAAIEWIINPTVITDAVTDIAVENDDGFDLSSQLVIEKKTSASGDASALLARNETISAVYQIRLLIDGIEQPNVGTYTIRIAVDTDAPTIKVLLHQNGAYSEITATVENSIAIFDVEKLGEFALVRAETPAPASANLWWLWLLISLIAATFAGYVALYLLWKLSDRKPISFLIPTFRKINKLIFKTEWNDNEIKSNQSNTSPIE